VNSASDRDADIRARIQQHWEASESGDADAEHAIYAADAILDYPQSGERFRGRSRIQAQRGGHPAERHFTVRRILGGGELWVSECVITYDGVPTYSVSVMEFAGGVVVHETQYFADPFDAPAGRAALAEAIPGTGMAFGLWDVEKPDRALHRVAVSGLSRVRDAGSLINTNDCKAIKDLPA
jgi:hypothetical protein